MIQLQQVKFARPVGIELTFVPDADPHGDGKDSLNYGWPSGKFREMCSEYRELAEAYGIRRQELDDFCRWGVLGTDPGCVEWSSPILYSWEQAQSWYEFAVALGEQLQFTTYHPEQVGGMGHVHMAMSLTQAQMVACHARYHPYLPWLFAEPAQTQFCRGKISCLPVRGQFESFTGMHELLRYTVSRGENQYGTLEWRGFDSACEWEEQEEHLAFYHRYVQVCLKRKKDYPDFQKRSDIDRYFSCRKNGYDRCVLAFKELINQLDLPWDRYEWYTECHLKGQFEWGELL